MRAPIFLFIGSVILGDFTTAFQSVVQPFSLLRPIVSPSVNSRIPPRALFDTTIPTEVPEEDTAVTTTNANTPSPSVARARKYASYFCNLFPVWTLVTAATALARPSTFLRIPSSTFPAQIGMLMLCMGITLKPADFKRVAQRPAAVLLAFVGCYGVVRTSALYV